MQTAVKTRKRTSRTLRLLGDHRLVIERTANADHLTIRGAAGQVCLSVHVTADGPVLRLEGAKLHIETTGDLSFEAERVRLHGRKEVAISSGGHASLEVAGDLEMEARGHDITARLGSVNVRANDDVKMNGERILMNC
jgi:hypothetical protein